MTWTDTIRRGAAAGLAGGVAAAIALWTLVEPQIARAIAIEGEAEQHAHIAGAAHDHSVTVSRIEQQVGGTLTLLLVACLLGLLFAVVCSALEHRLPGYDPLSRALVLGALAFVVHALVPALVLPADPPGVGDPTTVTNRSLTWMATILLGVIVLAACFEVARRLRAADATITIRYVAVAAVGIGGLTMVTAFVPSVPVDVPAHVPADLIWSFRVGSLVQLAAMWMTTAFVYGAFVTRARTGTLRPARPATART